MTGLKKLRRSVGLTQVQLAERCGMRQQDLSRIERGEINPTAKTIRRIAGGLGIDPGRVLQAIGEAER
jgi:transcriptional regulator with XRE-family HTH domain